MKNQIANILSKTPLLIRVVSLYVLLWPASVYILSLSSPVTPPPAAAIVVSEQAPATKPADIKEVRGIARRVELPRIGLSEEVIDGVYDGNSSQWTLTDDKVQYAVMTTTINNVSGQTLLYGHNTSAVLEPVKDVQPGDELLVTSEDGKVFVYTYTEDRFVVPTDISVLSETPEKPRVVLMTCEGWLSETRRLLYFDFKEVR